ncbi:recombinase [Clostridium botulinum]|nr:recombinase RecT [Clostridium botulinum]NFH72687.1 recombinase [Clostridium botulinum]NFJ73576.1 recombinase [Clostridium botulinum]NFN61308.1 recombinase [Clostridium botulinum]
MANNQIQGLVLKQTNTLLTNMLDKEVAALPKGFNTLRFKQNVLSVLNTLDLANMKGQEFNLAKCIMKGAYLDLDFANNECYVIIYSGKPEFMTDYKGETKLCRKFSAKPIKDIYAKLVRIDDEFEEGVDHGKPYINFKPIPFSNNDIIGVFAVVYYEDGSMEYESMSKADVEFIRDNFAKKSRKTGKFSDAWEKSFGEMAKKTALRRLCKHINIDFDNIEQLKAWEDGSDMEFESNKKSDETEAEKSSLEKELEENGELETDFVDTPFEVIENEDN